jgi:uncharacterized protein (TIGR03437 family)
VKRVFKVFAIATRDGSVQAGLRHAGSLPVLACLFACGGITAYAQNQPAPAQTTNQRPVRPLLLDQNRYRLRAGERMTIAAPQETVTFMRTAKSRSALATGASNRGFPVAPDGAGDQVLLGIPLTTTPGDYSVAVSFVSEAGEERSTVFQVTVEPFATAAAGSGVPPVVLLDGWQQPGASSCPMYSNSSQTFGNLQSYLGGSPNFVPAVYFFENCTECPNCTIEQLGADLGAFLNSINYTDGTPVPQMDVVAHSMGGLIVRSYLSGKQQASGAFSPPSNTKIRKAVFIGTPHFGSFQADSLLADIVFGLGNQTNEMKRGSQFAWDLDTWNQFGDDLRGVDAVAVIGNGGSYNGLAQASDGVVALSSGSLDFASPGRTRVVLNYCHILLTAGIEANYLGCTGPGIANIDLPSHPTYEIVSAFLLNSTAWQAVGNSPAQDQYLSKYGGMVVADVNSTDQFVGGLSEVSWGSVNLSDGAASGELFYSDFVDGTATFAFGASTCGPYTETAGLYSRVRCKFGPSVFSVGPLLPGSGRVVQAGTTITISGAGFGTQCAGCQVTASNPQATALQVSSWSNTAITAFLPASFGIGIATIGVTTASGSEAINIMAGTAALPPAISLSASSLSFTYTMGGTVPAAQNVTVANSGGGTLTWSATSSASWLTVSSSTSGLTVSVNPSGLSTGPHVGAITVSASGASNSPQTISVTLTVNAAPQPSLSLSASQASFSFTLGGSVPASQAVNITNTGAGTLAWSAASNSSWLTVSPTGGTGSGTLTLGINPAGLTARTYTGAVTVTASGATNSPAKISVTLTVNPVPASPVVVSAVVNAASWTGGTVAPGELVVIGGTMLGPSTGIPGTVDPSTGKMVSQLAGTTVLFDGVPAPLLYTSGTQVNAIVPYEETGCTQATLQVQYQGVLSSSMTLPCATAAPGIFTFNASGAGPAAAANQDGTFNGPSSPAAKGSYVTLYFTGGGQTNPAGVTGSITGTATLKWLTQTASVTVGGVAATVAFDGAAPTFVDGVLQLNIQLSANTPTGSALPVVITVGTVSSPNTATLAVQ